MNITIGLSYAPKEKANTHYYSDALLHAASVQEVDLKVIDLYSSPEKINDLDGIVFTGIVGAQLQVIVFF